ncbi:hypothetical protein RvY_03474-2 [Ramazzottius varieornatus]|nr:hypothetical protein RvY_03474-2 [Ramazzottius varieornatus]
MTRQRMLGMICAIWTLSLVISVVPFMGWSTPEEANPYKCNVQTDISYVLFSVSVSYYIPLVIILILYARIWQTARRHVQSLRSGFKRGSLLNHDGTVMTMRVHNRKFDKRPINSSTSSTSEQACRDSNNSHLLATPSSASASASASASTSANLPPQQPAKLSKSFAKQRKATITLTIIIFGFICMWQGFFLILPLSVLCPVSCQIPVILWKILFWLGYCNSLMNPFIYAAASPEFRRAFKRILCCAFISKAKRQRNLRYEMTLQPQRQPFTVTSPTASSSTPVSLQRVPVLPNSSPLSLSYSSPSAQPRPNACFRCLFSCCGRFCSRKSSARQDDTCRNCGASRRPPKTQLTSLHRTSSAPHNLATLNQSYVSIPRRRFLSFHRRKKQERSVDLMEDFPLASMTLARLKDPNTATDLVYGSLQALQKIAMEENPARTRHNSVVVLADGLAIPVMTSSRSLATQTPLLPTKTSSHSLASSVHYIFVPSAPDDAQL